MMVPKILLIDDDSDDRDFFCEALGELPHPTVCYTAANGRTALNQLDNKEIEKPDLIFLDINMPIMNGWQCLTILKEHKEYKNIPIIMYSTSSQQEEVDKAQQLGALCLFSKPPTFTDLKSSLEKVVKNLSNASLSSSLLNSKLFIS